MDFEIISPLEEVEIIAVSGGIRETPRLRRDYGAGRWRKLKGTARVRLSDGTECRAEIHRYEAHNRGRKEFKIKRCLE